ncbi:uncharacterized protein LOC130664803 [Microplitis mediator]|uniref:uncharacterized protein LOC130664803 n=1 Tax=Microplitis mediator TaxID=375433 RepID=UPI002553035A|nr:uncharacterized protein LOC130664803 [Microplitis mediator]
MAEERAHQSSLRRYWSNPVFKAPAFIGPNIPTTPNLLYRFHVTRDHRRTIVYDQPDSKLVEISDISFKPAPKPAIITTLPDFTRVPFIVPLTIKIGESTHESQYDLRDTVPEDTWRTYWRELCQKVEALSPTTRTVGTQTAETRLSSVPGSTGCLRCKRKGHSHQECSNAKFGDDYCTSCLRVGHNNNSCPYLSSSSAGFELMKEFCLSCKTQHPYFDPKCRACRTRVNLSREDRGAVDILPP